MARMTYDDAISMAIREEMENDSKVFIMGQDVELILFEEEVKNKLGPARIRSTPISEAGFIGAGIGAALTGMRPVILLGCSTFLYSAMDQVVNQAAKIRYMFGGQANVPLVIRVPVLYTISVAAHHSDRPWGMFAQAPGLKLIVPTTPYDAKGLMKAAIRDDNPVVCFEDVTLGDEQGDVPEGDYSVPIGLAEVKRAGADVTVVALGAAVQHSLIAARQCVDEAISVEVVDLRTVVPLDRDTILKSVRKTGRLIVVDPAPGMCSVASEVAATVAESAFGYLKAPIIRITAPDIPVPFSPALESLLYPTVERIAAAIRQQCSSRMCCGSAVRPMVESGPVETQ